MASLSNFLRAKTETQQQGFKADKYKIQQHMYPSDLMAQGSNYTANQYGGNYVIFYVNVAEDSKLLNSGNKLSIVFVPPFAKATI